MTQEGTGMLIGQGLSTLKRAACALVFAAAIALLGAAPSQAAPPKVLVFHPDLSLRPEARAGLAAIQELGAQGGFRVEATQDPTRFTGKRLAEYQAVVNLHADGNRLNGEQEGALADFIERGNGFLGIGAAAEAEPGSAFFDELIGARPDASSPRGTSTQTLVAGDRVHPSTRDLPLMVERSDVWYRWQNRPTGTVHTVARYHAPDAPAGDGTSVGGTDHPISWCRDTRGGRSFYMGMGRTAEAWSEERLRTHVLGAIQWAAGIVRSNCKATINANYRGTRLVSGGPVTTGLATSGESHGISIAPNGWVIYIGRGDCRTDEERGALIGAPLQPRILDHSNENVGLGCGNVHIWDPAEYNGTVNSGVTRAGVLAVYGDGGQGGERTNQANHKLEWGLLGVTVAPDFLQTGHIYLYYFPSFNPSTSPPGLPVDRRISKMSRPRISRFTIDLETKRLILSSEVRVFEYEAQIFSCCHVGGGMGFDSQGNLYVTTGDTNSSQGTGGYSGNNQPPTCPTGPPDEPSSAHCGSNAISYQDARRTAGNTNNYNGKMLRFNPIEQIPDGTQPAVGIGTTYTIPGADAPNGPNLFSGTEGGGGLTKPEIFAMGLRNPSRLSIDPDTDTPYTAWVGPDAGAPSATLGPSTYENAAQVDRAGNYGWPFCMGNKQAYRDRIVDGTPRETNAPGYVPGGPADGGTNGWYDCDNLINDSIRNDGLSVLPHTTGTGMNAGKMRPANLWYSRGNPDDDGNPQTNTNNGCPDFPRERGAENAPNYGAIPRQLCPYATAQGATIMNGPLYRFDEDASDDSVRWPEYWDGRWFLHNHGGPSIKHGLLLDPTTDESGGQPVYADSLRNTLSWQGNYMDSKFGPDGALYVQVYDGFFRANPNVGLYRFDYIGGQDTPGPDPQSSVQGGRRVAFSIGRSGGVSYRWDFGDGTSSTAQAPTHRSRSAGAVDVTLTVTYADGEQASETIEVVVS
jgi:glucose/arabinose dehydrogenase/type 1 glutamine amidotransferase